MWEDIRTGLALTNEEEKECDCHQRLPSVLEMPFCCDSATEVWCLWGTKFGSRLTAKAFLSSASLLKLLIRTGAVKLRGTMLRLSKVIAELLGLRMKGKGTQVMFLILLFRMKSSGRSVCIQQVITEVCVSCHRQRLDFCDQGTLRNNDCWIETQFFSSS